MSLQALQRIDIPPELVEAIREFPLEREVEHCGTKFRVSPFDIYANCPICRGRIKLRSFSGGLEIEDLFDAVFEWMTQPGAEEVVRQRLKDIEADEES